MQLILNKKVVLLLCFTINIIHFIECSTDSHEHVNVNESAHEPIVQNSADVSQSAAKVKYNGAVSGTVPKSEHAKNIRNIGGVQHNYRSSYVGNRLNRRVSAATAASVGASASTVSVNAAVAAKQAEDATTEHISLIKAKRKFDNDFSDEIKYNVGPGVNIGVEKEKELVSVYLDEDCLKDVFTGK